MKYNSSVLTAGLVVLILSCAGTSPAGPIPWPDEIQRGVNIGIFPGNIDRYSEEDIVHLARDWRANSVRFLINDLVPSEAPYEVDEVTMAEVHKLIGYCLKYRLYVVFAPSVSFRNPDALFNSPALKAAYRDFWVEFATFYADSAGVAYDLMNEPHGTLARTEWSDYAKELTAAIRQVDSVHTIVVEPPEWGWPNGMQYLEPTGDENTVYSFHYYGPMDFTHQRNNGHMRTTEQQWRSRVYPGFIQGEQYDKDRFRAEIERVTNWRDRYGVRIWCGEFGCARWALGADQWFADWISLLEEEKMDWAYYAYREWHHMDIEMDPAERENATERSETELVTQFRGYFARNEVRRDFNLDGKFDLADLYELIGYMIKHYGSAAADYNRDGRTNLTDVLRMLIELKAGE